MELKRDLVSDENGHTMVEVIVAMAILAVVLIPTAQFMAKVMASPVARDMMIATQLARGEMEEALAEPGFGIDFSRKRLNRIWWRIAKKEEMDSGLIRVTVRVFKKESDKPLVTLETLRLSNAQG